METPLNSPLLLPVKTAGVNLFPPGSFDTLVGAAVMAVMATRWLLPLGSRVGGDWAGKEGRGVGHHRKLDDNASLCL